MTPTLYEWRKESALYDRPSRPTSAGFAKALEQVMGIEPKPLRQLNTVNSVYCGISIGLRVNCV